MNAVWMAAALASAQSGAAQDVQITIYNDDLGLVRELRTIEPKASQVRIVDVAARIDPTSVHLRAADRKGELQVLEQSFRYDLASPERILERALDAPLRVLSEDGELHEGTLLSFTHDQLVLRGEEGLSMLRRDKIADLQLRDLPEGLITRPTLFWEIEAEGSSQRQAEISYLTGGVSWHAEYVVVTDEQDREAEVAAWVSINNGSGATYREAQLQLVAGDVRRVRQAPPGQPRAKVEYDAMSAKGGFQEEELFEYHLYTLPRRTTLHDRETKQISLFPPTKTPVKKVFEYEPWRDQRKIWVALELLNSEKRGLGMPLPKGKVRTYKRDRRGGQQFIGEDNIQHTPRDEEVHLEVGAAFDIVAEYTIVKDKRLSDRVHERSVRVEFRNRKEDPVELVARERMHGDWSIEQSSHEHRRIDAHTAEWTVPLPPGQVTELTYTSRTTR